MLLPSQPPMPQRPLLTPAMTTQQKLNALSRFIKEFEYNHTGEVYFRMRRDRGLKHVVLTAKEIMRDALPIQCVEAVFLAAALTAELSALDRYPLSFKSVVERPDGKRASSHRHIVLACHDRDRDRWGALGISRRTCLQNKELRFASLSALVEDYSKAYAKCGHALVRVYAGLPLAHDVHSAAAIRWRVFRVSLRGSPWADAAACIDAYVRDVARIVKHKGAGALQDFKAVKFPDQKTNADAHSSDGDQENPRADAPATPSTAQGGGPEEAGPAPAAATTAAAAV